MKQHGIAAHGTEFDVDLVRSLHDVVCRIRRNVVKDPSHPIRPEDLEAVRPSGLAQTKKLRR